MLQFQVHGFNRPSLLTDYNYADFKTKCLLSVRSAHLSMGSQIWIYIATLFYDEPDIPNAFAVNRRNMNNFVLHL